jgi:predicted DNA-binding protein YlxM (UPF0122 family)
MKIKDFILISEFAKRANVTVQAVYKAIKAGRITKVEAVGPLHLVHTSELKQFKGRA